MKTKALILTISFLAPLLTYGQKGDVIDDIYYKKSDVVKQQVSKTHSTKQPTYKNGAKEIIFYDADTVDIVTSDSTYTLKASKDSTDEGYYLNGFKGSQNDYEYAERIRKFHNPKFTIFIGDPNYNDIYFLNNWDWNVYVDGSYAYVTPTWTNPYWFDYMYRPYSYGSWYWRNNFFGSYYGGWGGWPYYGYGNYYGYSPFGWNYGWDYGYYGYGGYPYGGYYGYCDPWGWGGYGGGGYGSSHYENKAVRTSYGPGSRAGLSASTIGGSRMSSGASGSRANYSATSDENGNTRRSSVMNSSRPVRNLDNFGSRSAYTSSTSRSGVYSDGTRSSSGTTINTRPRTGYTDNSGNATRGTSYSYSTDSRSGSRSGSTMSSSYSTSRSAVSNGSGSVRSSYSTSSGSRASYSTGTPTYERQGSYSTRSSGSVSSGSSRSSDYSGSRSSSSSYSSPSYSSPSSSGSSGGGSYSGGGSSSGGGGGSRSSSGGGGGGGRR